jgi:hypothetical protein
MENVMRILKMFLTIAVIIGDFFSIEAVPSKPFTDHGFGKENISRFDNELYSKEGKELYDFLETKRTIPFSDKLYNLTIAGDVRVDWRHRNERDFFVEEDRSRPILGSNYIDAKGVRTSHNDFDIEFNLYLDYICERAWAITQIEFNESGGVSFNDHENKDKKGLHGSGFCCDVYLKKAYIGYNLCCDGDCRLDVELGRRRFYHIFDSEVQFLSQFDGLLLRYTSGWEWGNWYVYAGGFVIDKRANHFGWAAETGLLNIFDTGLDLEYSFIDWRKIGKNRYFVRNPNGCKFQVSQFTAHYHFDPEMVCTPAQIYGAFLWNHDAPKNILTHGKKKNLGWYAGFRIGEVVRCGDWAFDIQYQYVQAQVIPDRDVSGIGRGNFFDENFTQDGRGNTNYKGWRVEALYALTDNLTLNATLEASREINKTIGGTHRFSQFELEAIYAF